jgi:hypothetical protein
MPEATDPCQPDTFRVAERGKRYEIRVNKHQHDITFGRESEDMIEIIIEPKGDNP